MARLNVHIVLFLFLNSTIGFAQLSEPKQKLVDISAKMREAYGKLETFSYTMQQCYYLNSLNSEPIDKVTGKYAKSGKKIHQQVGAITTIKTPESILVINDDEKSLFLSVVMKINGGGEYLPIDLGTLDSSMNYVEVVRVEEEKKTEHTIEIKLTAGGVERFILSYNPVTYLPTQMVVFYAEKQTIYGVNQEYFGKPIYKVDFKDHKVSQPLASSLFNYTNYLSKTKSGYKPLPRYADYRFIDTSKSTVNEQN